MNKELTLRQIQESSFEILKKVDSICKELELDYFVMYGTLIGAIRHNGFIPWDDDLDIMMPREDYNKLIRYFERCDVDDLKLYNYNNCDNYPYMITRISDTRYKIIVENEGDYGIGTFIDVYPLDSLSNYRILALLKGRILGWLSSLYFLSTREYCPVSDSKFKMKSLMKIGAFRLSKLIGKNRLKTLLISKNNVNTKYLACRQWMTNDYKRNIFPSKLINGRVFIDFEGLEVPVPSKYHDLLEKYYGNYMEFPPEELQKPHHLYTAYKVK